MHYIKHVSPLLVCSLSQPVAIALLPVPMLHSRPSSDPKRFAEFYKPRGQLIPIHEDDALRVRKYMQRYETECLTSDGQTAFTLHGNQLMECDPLACGQPPLPLFVQFHPQTWVGEQPVSAGAAERVDVTDQVLAMAVADIATLQDCTPAANALVDAESRGHYGPYTVCCEAALRNFFGVKSLAELTQDIVDEMREGRARIAPRSSPELEGDAIWMMGVGRERVYFTCHAASIDDALAQTRTSFPGEPVSSACAVT